MRGRGELEDFSFYSEIFLEATSEASDIFFGYSVIRKFSGATQKLSVGFQFSKVLIS